MIFRAFRPSYLLVLLLAAGVAHAQQYRWTDKDGRIQYTDTPPPAWAKDIRKSDSATAKPAPAAVPFELARVQKDFPVSLYTSPNCKEDCELARVALNKRGVPFKEVQVWDPDSNAELKRLSGAAEVPTLLVGRSAQRGFEQGAFDALLDSAGYPKAGILPVLSQTAPAPPEGYISQEEADAAKPVALPVQPPEAGPKGGRYDASGLEGPPPKPGQYDPSGLTGPPPKTGQYGVPAESK